MTVFSVTSGMRTSLQSHSTNKQSRRVAGVCSLRGAVCRTVPVPVGERNCSFSIVCAISGFHRRDHATGDSRSGARGRPPLLTPQACRSRCLLTVTAHRLTSRRSIYLRTPASGHPAPGRARTRGHGSPCGSRLSQRDLLQSVSTRITGAPWAEPRTRHLPHATCTLTWLEIVGWRPRQRGPP